MSGLCEFEQEKAKRIVRNKKLLLEMTGQLKESRTSARTQGRVGENRSWRLSAMCKLFALM
jgi:hypothetical protein